MAYLRGKDQVGLTRQTVAIGLDPLKALTTGIDNIAVGTSVADALTTGICNVALGANALGASTTGCKNIAIGQLAMGGADTTGGNNVAIGTTAMDVLTSGTDNVAIGQNALGVACTGKNNIAIGQTALGAVTTGCRNIAIGDGAGTTLTTAGCIINIGCGVDNTTAGTTCIGGGCVMATQFTATSDCRSKCKIKDLPYGLSFINLLRPVSYKWKPQADKLDKDGNLIEEGEKSHTHQRTNFGLLGQQVKETLTKLGLNYNDFSGYQDKEEEHGPSGWKPSYTEENKTISLAYDDFIAPLIKSVQELSAEVDSLKAQLKTT